jgi:hypothetical protein
MEKLINMLHLIISLWGILTLVEKQLTISKVSPLKPKKPLMTELQE